MTTGLISSKGIYPPSDTYFIKNELSAAQNEARFPS